MPDVPQVIHELVEKFERGLHEYKSPDYNETSVRVQFVNPFFTALGWDVDNVKGHASAYRDVFHEDRLKVGEATKAPDYSFRIGGARKFFATFVKTCWRRSRLKRTPTCGSSSLNERLIW